MLIKKALKFASTQLFINAIEEIELSLKGLLKPEYEEIDHR